MSNYMIQSETLTSIADAIRAKIGKTESVAVKNMASSIEAIEDGSAIAGAIADKSITSLTLPEGLASIGEYSFYRCQKLTNLSMPDSIKTIEARAFHFCENLNFAHLPKALTKIGGSAFAYCAKIALASFPPQCTLIEDHAFERCTGLTSITFPEIPIEIQSYAFSECTGLKEVRFTSEPKEIYPNAFLGCSDVTFNVAWGQSHSHGAPWGATNATINYIAEDVVIIPETTVFISPAGDGYVDGNDVEIIPYKDYIVTEAGVEQNVTADGNGELWANTSDGGPLHIYGAGGGTFVVEAFTCAGMELTISVVQKA